MISALISRLTGTQLFKVIHIRPEHWLHPRIYKSNGRCIDRRKFATVRARNEKEAALRVPLGNRVLHVIQLGGKEATL